MVGCLQVRGIVLPGDFMLSLERVYDKHGTLARTPKKSAGQLSRAPKGHRDMRGLGQEGQEWFCLQCVEALFHRMNENGGQNNTTGYDPRFQALFAIANWIIADERACNDCPGCFRLATPYRYGLELWKAVKLEDQSRLDGFNFVLHCPKSAQVQPCDLFLGEDGESRYLNEDARDINHTFPNSVSIKTVMKAADVRGKWLREVLAFVGDLIAREGTVAPMPRRQSHHHIGGASLSDCTAAELAIWNCSDNEFNPKNARNRRQRASNASTSAANLATPAHVSNSSRTALRRSGHQHRHPNRPAVGRGTSKNQPDSSSAAAGTPKAASKEATSGAEGQDTGLGGDAVTTAAGSDKTEPSSNTIEETPPSSSTAAIIATPPTASHEATSNDMSNRTPDLASNEPPTSPETLNLAPTPPPQSRKRGRDVAPLSQIPLLMSDIYELVAREREAWAAVGEENDAKRRRRDEGLP